MNEKKTAKDELSSRPSFPLTKKIKNIFNSSWRVLQFHAITQLFFILMHQARKRTVSRNHAFFSRNRVTKKMIHSIMDHLCDKKFLMGGGQGSKALSSAQALFDLAAQRSDPLLPLSAQPFLTLALSAPT